MDWPQNPAGVTLNRRKPCWLRLLKKTNSRAADSRLSEATESCPSVSGDLLNLGLGSRVCGPQANSDCALEAPGGAKKGPRDERGPKCLGSLVMRELGWRPATQAPPERKEASRAGLRLCQGRSAPVEGAALWGDATSWAAKLFSINRMRTLFALANRACSSPAAGALPRATECIR